MKPRQERANLIPCNAIAEADRMKNNVINIGTRDMLTELGIFSEEHSISTHISELCRIISRTLTRPAVFHFRDRSNYSACLLK
jgi:hypothetical protein